MKNVLFRKFVLSYIIVSMFFCVSIVSFAVAEKQNCAEIIFGEQMQTNNISIVGSYGYKATKIEGRNGVISDKANAANFIYFDIGDNFMFDLANKTPIDITVEYFDGEGIFCLQYDSTEPLIGLVGHLNNVEPKIWNCSEVVRLENSQTWKSYTFHLEDLKAANGIYGWGDFRLGIWDAISEETSSQDVIFGSMKIERSEYRTPIDIKVSSEYVGNIFSAEEDIVFKLDCLNKTDKKIIHTLTYKVYDESDKLVSEGEMKMNFAPEEQKEETLTIKNPGLYGKYRIIFGLDSQNEVSASEVWSEKMEEQFTVSTIFESGKGNSEIGVCQQISVNSRGNPAMTGELTYRAGVSFLRDGARDVTKIDGKYIVNESSIRAWKTFKESGGGEILIILEPQDITGEGMPDTPERYAEYAKYCADVVEQLKGITNYFEIWNEPNITFGNPKLVPYECYAQMCKAAYPAIKKANPDAFVVIGVTAASGSKETWFDYEFHDRIFKAGAFDYMDALSVHPYDWSGSFDEERFIKGFEDAKEMMAEYGGGKELWISEFGFSSNPGGGGGQGYTQTEQYQNMLLSYNLMKSYDMVDKCFFYCFYDRLNPLGVESNWGWTRYNVGDYKGAFYKPSEAKKVYIAMAAASRLIGDKSICKEVIREERAYATHYYNEALGKDVLYLQTGIGEKNMNFDLGCRSVDIYDSYGNKLNAICSDSGVYSFLAEKEPLYVVGDFIQFVRTDVFGAVVTDVVTKDAAVGDSVYFEFTKNTDKELKISVEDAEVIENNGFSDNKASICVKIPDTAQGTIKFKVVVTDNEGNIYYYRDHFANIVPPVKVTIVSEQVAEGNLDRWRLRAVVENLTNNGIQSGAIKITEPVGVADINVTRRFEQLQPHEKITFLFNIPKKINKSVIHTKMEIQLDSGYIAEFTNNTCFSAAAYADKVPVIDGNIGMNEWTGSWIGANEAKDYVALLVEPRKDAEDLSFSGTMMWDYDNFYFMAIVTDDVFFTGHEPGGIANTWRGDSLQIGLDDRIFVNSVEEAIVNEFSIAYVPGVGDIVYKQSSIYEKSPSKVVLENAEVVVKRYDTYTAYECKIPWDEIFYADYVLRPDDLYKFSVLANDNDGNGRKGYIEYTSGIGKEKSVSLYGDLRFNK